MKTICWALVVVCSGSSLCDAQTTWSTPEIRSLLEKKLAEFANRPSYSVEFRGEYHLKSGAVGPHASREESTIGAIRYIENRLEMRQVDESFSEQHQAYRPVRDERSIWEDGRRVGLRRFVGNSETEQPFTSVKKFHDAVRPDLVGWFADGILYDSEHFAATLLRCDNVVARLDGDPDGVQRLHIWGTVPEGRMDVWLTAGDRHDLVAGRFETSAEYAKKLGDVTSATIDLGSVHYEDIGVDRLPVYAEAVYTYDIPGEGAFEKAVNVSRTNYRLNPDSDTPEEFQFKISEGARVVDYDDARVRWEWRDGELLKL